MSRFRDAKVCNNWLQIGIDDHRVQSDHKYKSELQNPEGKNSTLGIASAWWNRATRRATPMTTWPPRPRAPSTQRTWTSTRECAVLLFASQVLVVMIHTLHRMAQGCCACHLIHAWIARFSFDFESSIPFFFLIFPFILDLLHFLLHFFHYLEGRSNPVYSA